MSYLATDTHRGSHTVSGRVKLVRGCQRLLQKVVSYTQANPDAHTQRQLGKPAKSSHGQLVTLHIGSQRVGRTVARCVHERTLLRVCVYTKRGSSRPLQRGMTESIQFPVLLCSGLATVCQQGTRTIYTIG